MHLTRLEIVARIELVGNAHRADVECFDVGEEIIVAQGQHVQHTGLGQVVAVLGATFPLCQPDGLALLAQHADVCTQLPGVRQLCMRTGTAFDHKTAQVPHHHLYPFSGEQVIAHTHERTNAVTDAQQVRQPGGIHDDVAVVGHEKRTVLDVLLYLLAVAQVVQTQTLRPPPRPGLQQGEEDKQVRYP